MKNMPNRTTVAGFIEKARAKHGDIHDYSRVRFIQTVKSKVEIKCKVHGVWFGQTVQAHLRHLGCRECVSDLRRAQTEYTLEVFVEKAKRVHEDRYDYSETKYNGSHEPVTMRCIAHDRNFTVSSASQHVRGQGCPKCPKLGIRRTRNNLHLEVA